MDDSVYSALDDDDGSYAKDGPALQTAAIANVVIGKVPARSRTDITPQPNPLGGGDCCIHAWVRGCGGVSIRFGAGHWRARHAMGPLGLMWRMVRGGCALRHNRSAAHPTTMGDIAAEKRQLTIKTGVVRR